MKKIILMFTITLLAVAMVLTPMVGMVYAGKGQKKLEFKLHYTGVPITDDDTVMRPAGKNTHFRGRIWELAGENIDFYIEIGVAGVVERIEGDRLRLDVSMDTVVHNTQGERGSFFCNAVIDTITIYTDDTKVTERGTIEIRGHNNPTGKAQNCVGFGTEQFEGVKISGTSTISRVDGVVNVNRIGTVMGWPIP